MVKTAVLMATYNGEKFLKNQLDSIRDQELSPDHVLLRDDGSTDQTVALLTDYIAKNKLTNWTINVNEKNIGWRLNFRQLLIDSQELAADIVFFSDQDDVWHLDKNGLQAAVLAVMPNIDVLSGDIDIQKLSENATVPAYFQFADREQTLSKYPSRNTYESYRSGWTLAMRSTFVAELLKYWQSDYEVTHDVLITTLSSLMGTGYNLNRSVGTHIRHAGNASGLSPITIYDTKEKDTAELYKAVGFYDIMRQVLKDRGSFMATEIENYYQFARKRYEISKSGKKLPVFKQLFTDWFYYAGMSSRIRDIIFAFKK